MFPGRFELWQAEVIWELNNIQHRKMKDKVITTYFKHHKLLLKSKHYSRIVVIVVNIWVVAHARVSSILKWTKWRLINSIALSEKPMTIQDSPYHQANIHRLYKKCKGGRGLINVKVCINSERGNMSEYLQQQTKSSTVCR